MRVDWLSTARSAAGSKLKGPYHWHIVGGSAHGVREGNPASRVRCVVADDHPAVLDVVCRYLEDEGEVELVGSAQDGQSALRLIEERRADVAVLDIRMPGLDGVEVVRRLTSAGVPTAVILFTGFAERALLVDALDAGARGFLGKEAPLTDLVRAIKTVAGGGTFVDPTLAGFLAGPSATARLPSLTQREREVLRLLADGMRNEQVGLELSISPLTVRTHVRNAMAKLEADTRTQAVASALRQALIG